MPALKRPDVDEYPPPNTDDFVNAAEACLDDDLEGSHFKRGRYTAHTWYVEPMPDMKPGDKVHCVIVEACERDIVAMLPVEQADDLLDAIKTWYN